MVITYNGDNYFKIQSGNFTVLIDPGDRRSFRGANAVLSTLKPAEAVPDEGETFFVDNQGEYEVGDLALKGISLGYEGGAERTAYRFELEGIKVLVLGHLVKEPAAETQEYFHGADVVIAPAGGKPYLSETLVGKIVRQIEPALIIPTLFNPPAGGLKNFLREFNKSECVPEEKLVLKAKDLKAGAMEVRCLK
ncbi:MAG: hypothetical protein UY26_C0001G0019 [Candidatus Jorgensenbacteria bacterium GW2011_GWA1_48_13]|uniref:Zn-dependent hydrolase of the beta-lactamase fold-like protein n=2 Tax=Candidatus Joergenseniibacteriota TaxID=1752739 RepID=A0A0G1W9L4_9BACT|nr:MAG: hypothetical protein UY26_C0001G0019 [Candidatus Jorgensenbacteria bacterium GW2011_GWA1_48_13]KKU99380.1 MAG: Zn-dependent hydrolase of the beta-lactamase fold-like protein [Candidatus Jorgensenbacteria bacterium GW2011_GWC1_48_8]KKW15265.1 MAG: hypothetical protein UY55_C0001G0019 [Candidatus Jorgensenbacteria bacterium GW2011_GWB1_50_10]